MTQWKRAERAAAVDAILGQAPVVPVLTIDQIDAAVPLARALVAAGLPVLEVTLRSDVALDAIARINAEVPAAIVGAGTVLGAADLDRVIAAGARFALSPGASDALYRAAASANIPFIPGIATASELMQGLFHGHQRFKFFPAEAAGGIEALTAFAGPFPAARFCPTGGINQQNAAAYLALGNVITVGGSWMAPGRLVRARDWDGISVLAGACAGLRTAKNAGAGSP